MSRTVRKTKTKELKAKDFYQTHPAMIKALKANYNITGTILDPCCGEGLELKRGGNTSYAWYEFSYNNQERKYEIYADLTEYL